MLSVVRVLRHLLLPEQRSTHSVTHSFATTVRQGHVQAFAGKLSDLMFTIVDF